MQGTVHLLFGAALAALIPHQPTMFAVAFFSHYILDLFPHIDAETFAVKVGPYTIRQKMSLLVDVVLVLLLLGALFLLRSEPVHFLLGAIAAQLPDLLTPLERYRAFLPMKRIHFMFHWNEKRANSWGWYVAGLAAPSLVAGGSVYVLIVM